MARFKWNYFNDILFTLYFSLMLFAFSQLYDLSGHAAPAHTLSLILAFAFIVAGLIFPFWLAYFLYQNRNGLLEQTFEKEVG